MNYTIYRVCSIFESLFSLCPLFTIPFVITLSVTATVVIKPYRFERDHFLDTTCNVTRHTEYGFHSCTYRCGRTCKRYSKFPCVVITVEIRDKDNRTKESSLAIHHGEERTCSVYGCGASVRKTTEEIRKTLQQWPIGRQAPCIYNRLNHTQTRERRLFSPSQAFNALFWPLWGTIVAVMTVVMCLSYPRYNCY